MDDLTDNITQEIDEMFAEFSGYRYLGVSSSLFEDMQIFEGPRNTDYHPINIFNENLADVFINWYDVWAAQHGNNGDINAFLRAENLHELLNKEQFVDLVGGRAFV